MVLAGKLLSIWLLKVLILVSTMTAALTPKNIEQMLALVALGRVGEPEEVAEVVTFLAARGAYIPGAAYVVDGGLSL